MQLQKLCDLLDSHLECQLRVGIMVRRCKQTYLLACCLVLLVFLLSYEFSIINFMITINQSLLQISMYSNLTVSKIGMYSVQCSVHTQRKRQTFFLFFSLFLVICIPSKILTILSGRFFHFFFQKKLGHSNCCSLPWQAPKFSTFYKQGFSQIVPTTSQEVERDKSPLNI